MHVQQEPILVIAAHADDIEFAAAGTIAKWAAAGHPVTYCIVTDGSAGSNEPGANLATLVARRQEEQRAAAAVLGVHDVRFLGYRDGILQPTLDLRRELTRLIREVRPFRVLCQDPTLVFAGNTYINHPDHRAAGEAALYAVFPSAETRPIFPELLAEGYEPHKVRELYLMFPSAPDLYLDISDRIEQKIESLLCHRSQLGPEVADWVRTWDAENGTKIGVAYAETFRVIRLVDN
ncbi:MAG TPA: PIG-L family deacetylase [Chloroflexus aurantiacus]|jgi:LmbE family N-acetylglucosaminyl deacetylase|uniref:LmbE family protein n=1 Tax=Chloroflexus aurantiacus (strain ATCC 29366 / DSM 635 / J-10-fl) TaxID=324602 RepID=A9WIU4_CHLAA|nr:PIG-L deacetylase family protein [Chloroflexus aurantiacus]ABY35821.1 LmbE family protein [Chloroflexus aurantiacus J-10-fl]RMG51714.1 MAG: PIG-L family deacetylase [Chloroflexota bacterium]GIV91699.1 MAG: GlcNAc-PI de-N-acetylase [Chloroflexus sp.]HBW69313.1 PIG-L family deacetylase [Chloroflexus aurantiacus]